MTGTDPILNLHCNTYICDQCVDCVHRRQAENRDREPAQLYAAEAQTYDFYFSNPERNTTNQNVY